MTKDEQQLLKENYKKLLQLLIAIGKKISDIDINELIQKLDYCESKLNDIENKLNSIQLEMLKNNINSTTNQNWVTETVNHNTQTKSVVQESNNKTIPRRFDYKSMLSSSNQQKINEISQQNKELIPESTQIENIDLNNLPPELDKLYSKIMQNVKKI